LVACDDRADAPLRDGLPRPISRNESKRVGRLGPWAAYGARQNHFLEFASTISPWGGMHERLYRTLSRRSPTRLHSLRNAPSSLGPASAQACRAIACDVEVHLISIMTRYQLW